MALGELCILEKTPKWQPESGWLLLLHYTLGGGWRWEPAPSWALALCLHTCAAHTAPRRLVYLAAGNVRGSELSPSKAG